MGWFSVAAMKDAHSDKTVGEIARQSHQDIRVLVDDCKAAAS